MAALSLGLTTSEYEERVKEYERALDYQRLLEKQLKQRMRYVSDDNAPALLAEYKTLQDQWEAIRKEHSKQLGVHIRYDGTITATIEQEQHDIAMAKRLGLPLEAYRERIRVINAKNRRDDFFNRPIGGNIFQAEEKSSLIEAYAERVAKPLPSPIVGGSPSE
jgi:hypothetical protein